MSRYHQNAKEIPTIGRRLIPISQNANINSLNLMLHPGEALVGCYDNGVYKIAPVLTTQGDVDEFYRQYARGMFLTMGYYAVPQEKLKI
jgi:hypothetical protein